MLTTLKRVAEHKQVGFWTFVVGIVFTLGLYLYDKEEGRPNLTVFQVRPIDVLDLRRQLPKLEIIYDGRDVVEEGVNLAIYKFIFTNSGRTSITKNLYDENDPLGLELRNGVLAAEPTLESSSEYLRSNLGATVVDRRLLRIAPVILDPGDSFSLEMVVIHEGRELPHFSVIGKIAGIRTLGISLDDAGNEQPAFLETAFFGSIGVQAVRAAAYFFIFVFTLIAVIFLLVGVITGIEKVQRYRRISDFQKFARGLTEIKFGYMSIFRDRYERDGVQGLRHLEEFLQTPAALADAKEWFDAEEALKKIGDKAPTQADDEKSGPAQRIIDKIETSSKRLEDENRATMFNVYRLRMIREFGEPQHYISGADFKNLVQVGAVTLAEEAVVDPVFKANLEELGAAAARGG